MTFYDELFESLKPKAVHTVWAMSDLQQHEPSNAERCLNTLLSDFDKLGKPAEQIWCLGDSVQGDEVPHLERMAQLQLDGFSALGIPLCYATGNHDYDLSNTMQNRCPGQTPRIPFYEAVRSHEGWHTTASMEDFYFKKSIGDFPVYFFCDHIDRQNRWLVTHGEVRRGQEYYPYHQEDMDRVRAEIAAENHPVITCAHYAFKGGNRASKLLSSMMPLPSNLCLHLFGHSHMGEGMFGGENLFRRIAWASFEDVPQINVSSMEDVRGEYCRSVLMQIYADGTFGLFFRNHNRGCFVEAYFPAKDRYTSPTPEERERILELKYFLA